MTYQHDKHPDNLSVKDDLVLFLEHADTWLIGLAAVFLSVGFAGTVVPSLVFEGLAMWTAVSIAGIIYILGTFMVLLAGLDHAFIKHRERVRQRINPIALQLDALEEQVQRLEDELG